VTRDESPRPLQPAPAAELADLIEFVNEWLWRPDPGMDRDQLQLHLRFRAGRLQRTPAVQR
jgi:hypothetical protein